MAFREYKIGVRLFGLALGGSMMITLYMPSLTIVGVGTSEIGITKELSYGRISGFSYEDPFNNGDGKPLTVRLNKDPKTGAAMDTMDAYVYKAGIPFPNGIRHPRILGTESAELTTSQGQVGSASESSGAVFVVGHGTVNGKEFPYIENATATRGWTPDGVLATAGEANTFEIGAGKIIFVREQCWWCHTLLPEQTQDWQYFGVPPRLGDFNGESPTAFGSDRKAPDLMHVGSRNSSREWMLMHFFNPRLVQPHSIMPRFDYLWGQTDANGQAINFDQWRKDYDEYVEGKRIYPPEVPEYAKDTEIKKLIDFVLSLK
ncbi:MAG: cbb3-type cytochrome c oxidase subunit II [Gammaproteobacteria bacterium]